MQAYGSGISAHSNAGNHKQNRLEWCRVLTPVQQEPRLQVYTRKQAERRVICPKSEYETMT